MSEIYSNGKDIVAVPCAVDIGHFKEFWRKTGGEDDDHTNIHTRDFKIPRHRKVSLGNAVHVTRKRFGFGSTSKREVWLNQDGKHVSNHWIENVLSSTVLEKEVPYCKSCHERLDGGKCRFQRYEAEREKDYDGALAEHEIRVENFGVALKKFEVRKKEYEAKQADKSDEEKTSETKPSEEMYHMMTFMSTDEMKREEQMEREGVRVHVSCGGKMMFMRNDPEPSYPGSYLDPEPQKPHEPCKPQYNPNHASENHIIANLVEQINSGSDVDKTRNNYFFNDEIKL